MTAHEAKDSEVAAQEQAATAGQQKAVELPEGALVYEAPEFFPKNCPTWLRTVVEDLWSFTLIHYNIWAVPVVVLFYFMYQVRLSLQLLFGVSAGDRQRLTTVSVARGMR